MADKTYASIAGFECKIFIDNEQVGYASSVSVNVANNIDRFASIGTRISKIKEGVAEITGSMSEGFINTARMKLVMGYDPLDPPTNDPVTGEEFNPETVRLPTFTLKFITSTATQTQEKDKRGFTCTVSGVKMDTWSVDINKDDFIIQDMDFIATDIEMGNKDSDFNWE